MSSSNNNNNNNNNNSATSSSSTTNTNNNNNNNINLSTSPHKCSRHHPSTVDTEELFGSIRRSIERESINMFKPTETNGEASENNSAMSTPRSQTSSFQTPSPSAYTVLHLPAANSSTHNESSELQNLLDNNRNWAQKMEQQYPGFFTNLKNQQKPKYMWIGCSDSRVPSTEITGLIPGEIFVHRNVANVVIPTDLNLLSCLQIAIDVLKVEHIIVCGHYGCAGIYYALTPVQIGISDYWIRSIKDIARHHADKLAAIETDEERHALLSELNVLEQVNNVCHTPIVQDAWRRNQPLTVHGWIYGVGNGLIKNLVSPAIKGFDQVSPAYHFDDKV